MKRFPIHFLHLSTFLEKCYFRCICISLGKMCSSQPHQTAECVAVAVIDQTDWHATHPYIQSYSAALDNLCFFTVCIWIGSVKGRSYLCDIVDNSAVN